MKETLKDVVPLDTPIQDIEMVAVNPMTAISTDNIPAHYERDQQFFGELEEVLDEYFPKVEKEGEEKRLMKRGDALMLFSEANLIHSKLLATARAEERSKVQMEYLLTFSNYVPLGGGDAEPEVMAETVTKVWGDSTRAEERERIEKIVEGKRCEVPPEPYGDTPKELTKDYVDMLLKYTSRFHYNEALQDTLTAINQK